MAIVRNAGSLSAVPKKVWLVRIGSKRRLTLPLEVKRRLGIQAGEMINIKVSEQGMQLELPRKCTGQENSRTGHTAALPPTVD
jgi:bifunctional DNA-binding transcriptional regulator/antitoxin component of YhaV-PrlF toxin-antitoxin module